MPYQAPLTLERSQYPVIAYLRPKMLYFLITIKKCGENLRYLSWKNAQKNGRTFTLKIHRLYATKNKGSDITSDPLSFLCFIR